MEGHRGQMEKPVSASLYTAPSVGIASPLTMARCDLMIRLVATGDDARCFHGCNLVDVMRGNQLVPPVGWVATFRPVDLVFSPSMLGRFQEEQT